MLADSVQRAAYHVIHAAKKRWHRMRYVYINIPNAGPAPWFVRATGNQPFLSHLCLRIDRLTGNVEAWMVMGPPEIDEGSYLMLSMPSAMFRKEAEA
jgi:hypothetical protein